MELKEKMVVGVVAGALMLVLTAGVALAASINCGSIQQYPDTPGCFGTDGADLIVGREARDIIYANGGYDEVKAASGNDDVYGEGDSDYLYGSDGNDDLYGGADPDSLLDNTGSGDTDELRGGGSNDGLDAKDGDAKDLLICGPGDNDSAYFDRLPDGSRDTVDASCETKHPNENLPKTK